MFCENCGSRLDEMTGTCPNCNSVFGASQTYSNSFDVEYQQHPSQEIKTTGILVWSIIELLCINMIAGVIAFILYFTQLKPAVESGDLNGVQKSKKTIKIILWVGIVLWVLIFLGGFAITAFLFMVPNMNSTKDLGIEGKNKINDLQSILENDSSYVEEYDYDYGRYYDYDF